MVITLVILSTAIGTLTGVIATLLLMQHRGRVFATGAEVLVRHRIPELEQQLADATANVIELRNQIVAQEQLLQQHREEIANQQQPKAEADQRAPSATHATLPEDPAFLALSAELEAVKREREDLSRRLRDVEARAAAEQELHQQEKRKLINEMQEFETNARAERLAVRAELDGVRRENEELAAQLREWKAKQAAEFEMVHRQRDALEAARLREHLLLAEGIELFAQAQRKLAEILQPARTALAPELAAEDAFALTPGSLAGEPQ